MTTTIDVHSDTVRLHRITMRLLDVPTCTDASMGYSVRWMVGGAPGGYRSRSDEGQGTWPYGLADHGQVTVRGPLYGEGQRGVTRHDKLATTPPTVVWLPVRDDLYVTLLAASAKGAIGDVPMLTTYVSRPRPQRGHSLTQRLRVREPGAGATFPEVAIWLRDARVPDLTIGVAISGVEAVDE